MFWFRIYILPEWPIQIAHEMAGKEVPLTIVTGKLKTRTKWGARRVLKKVYRSNLVDIDYVGKDEPVLEGVENGS